MFSVVMDVVADQFLLRGFWPGTLWLADVNKEWKEREREAKAEEDEEEGMREEGGHRKR